MDRLGGATNAFTTKESTCFYTKVLKEDLGRGIRLLQDLILHPEFPGEDLEREKGVVIEEIAMCEDNPEDLVHELLSDAQYKGHPLGLPILGTEEIIRGITREKLFRFLQTHYTPENTVISIAGAYDWQRPWTCWKRPSAPGPRAAPPCGTCPPRPFCRTTSSASRTSSRCSSAWAIPPFAGNAPESYAQLILSTLFGGSMSSRLFQSIRERNGLAYSVYSYVNVYSGAGEMELYAGTSPETAQQVADLMGAEVRKLLREGIGRDEFEKARQSARISFVMGQESNTSRMRGNGNVLLLYNTTRSFEEILDRLEKTTCDDVNDVARRIFSAPFCTAVVGRAGQPLSFAAF